MAASERRGNIRGAEMGDERVPKIESHVEPNEERTEFVRLGPLARAHDENERCVIGHVRKHVNPDFLTHAWCKFYEYASVEPNLIPREAIEKRCTCTRCPGRSCSRRTWPSTTKKCGYSGWR